MSLSATIQRLSKQIRSMTTSAVDGIGEIRAQIAEKKKARDRARDLPLRIDDVTPVIAETVAKRGQHWTHEWGTSLVYGDQAVCSPSRRGDVNLPKYGAALATFDALCAADPKRAEHMLLALAQRVEYEAGPALADRPALIEQLEREIAELELAEEALVDEAAAAGVVIEHRPEVIQRRQQEARARELEATQAAALRQREQRLDERHEQRRVSRDDQHEERRAGRSEYLAAGMRKLPPV